MDLTKLSKFELAGKSARKQSQSIDGVLSIIIKLKPDKAAPSYVKVRSRMGPQIMTADVHEADVVRLQADKSIESMSMAKPLAMIK